MRLTPPTHAGRLARDEHGFTLIFAIITMLVCSLLVAAALSAASEDAISTGAFTNQQKAYFAALAGIDEYKYQLTANPEYWEGCPKVPATGTTPVAVPGTPSEKYTVKTLPANGHATCEKEKQATIIETSVTASGTFRVEATGYAGEGSLEKERSIVATFKHPSFLDYVFLSNFEVEDPSTFTPEPKNCAHYYNERKALGVLEECPAIPFIPEDELNGPFHTNDAVAICGVGATEPTFGRNSSDAVEMGEGHYAWTTGCGNSPTIKGEYTENAATLLPPETDNELLEAAGEKFEGRTVIELENTTPKNQMKVTTYNFSTGKYNAAKTVAFPANGVVYVSNHGTCPTSNKYSPFNFDGNYEKDETTPACGNVYVRGKYTESLTIAAQNDIVIIGNVETTPYSNAAPTGNATLGLIANNFVRVYHPVVKVSGTITSQTCPAGAKNQNAAEDVPRKWGSLTNPVIDAAILSTQHSWIVDNFTCGSALGELTVWGAIAEFWRGRVTGNLAGEPYVKNYNYDERLRTKQPPNFLSPTTTAWHVARETQPPE